MRSRFQFLMVLVLLFVCFPLASSMAKERTLAVKEILDLSKVPKGATDISIWFPVPPSTPHQQVLTKQVDTLLPHLESQDSRYGNPLLFFETESAPPEELTISYQVVRREQEAFQSQEEAARAANPLYLRPQGLVIIDDRIRQMASDITSGYASPYEKARAIYNYVYDHMTYDKSGVGWGKGDVVYACDVKKGNCTDFHSLFIALARASGIPATFKMGYPVPKEQAGEVTSRYHCWAEFYTEAEGWVPVDISEAWKHPEKKEYLFGHLDENRVLLTSGREITLSPAQQGESLNYLAGPYIEVDGVPFHNFKVKRIYHNI